MIITIHQPDFLPWLGFFDRWQASDLYIILDDVQFLRRGWHHRDKIKTLDGPRWLTVPVIKKNNFFQEIKDVKIDNAVNWQKKHLRTIELNYKKADNFKGCFEEISRIYNKRYKFLIDFNVALLENVAKSLGIETPFLFSSSFCIKQASSLKLVELVKAVQGTEYLTGLGSKDYLDEELFSYHKIKIVWQNYKQLKYPQLYGEFESKLSVIDYLMNVVTDKVDVVYS